MALITGVGILYWTTWAGLRSPRSLNMSVDNPPRQDKALLGVGWTRMQQSIRPCVGQRPILSTDRILGGKRDSLRRHEVVSRTLLPCNRASCNVLALELVLAWSSGPALRFMLSVVRCCLYGALQSPGRDQIVDSMLRRSQTNFHFDRRAFLKHILICAASESLDCPTMHGRWTRATKREQLAKRGKPAQLSSGVRSECSLDGIIEPTVHYIFT
jgi:hypothetical protein